MKEISVFKLLSLLKAVSLHSISSGSVGKIWSVPYQFEDQV